MLVGVGAYEHVHKRAPTPDEIEVTKKCKRDFLQYDNDVLRVECLRMKKQLDHERTVHSALLYMVKDLDAQLKHFAKLNQELMDVIHKNGD